MRGGGELLQGVSEALAELESLGTAGRKELKRLHPFVVILKNFFYQRNNVHSLVVKQDVVSGFQQAKERINAFDERLIDIFIEDINSGRLSDVNQKQRNLMQSYISQNESSDDPAVQARKEACNAILNGEVASPLKANICRNFKELRSLFGFPIQFTIPESVWAEIWPGEMYQQVRVVGSLFARGDTIVISYMNDSSQYVDLYTFTEADTDMSEWNMHRYAENMGLI